MRAPTPVEELRQRARRSVESGAVTPGYAADRSAVIEMLNAALATELVCVLRYKRHYFTASGVASDSVAAEFLEHAQQEAAHADRIAERIVQLGGEPDFAPQRLMTRSHAEYSEAMDLGDMVRDNLIAERVAIESYREMIELIGSRDPTTRRLFEQVLADEEEHAEDLVSLMADLPRPGASQDAS